MLKAARSTEKQQLSSYKKDQEGPISTSFIGSKSAVDPLNIDWITSLFT